ncbi:hypothetical protein GP486_002526 [Trichoglossum hirsutum]|uniref:Fungal-type protein kinase domain-containing protein n=1 Tax=Trichoglossum hirsutum TaxID=265104 RepID=A0A9P8LEW4_9PEZI|nr:hypothetical protein GP486_002526 [Trichoglossum hirsutum]
MATDGVPSSGRGTSSRFSSTPVKSHRATEGDEYSDRRATTLYCSLCDAETILVESTRGELSSPMIDEFIGESGVMEGHITELLGSEELDAFLRSAGGGRTNEAEFSRLIDRVTSIAIRNWNTDVRYLQLGHQIMQHRSTLLPSYDGRWGLKPDFITSTVRIDPHTGKLSPHSLSTMLQPAEAREGSSFNWEDVRSLCEITSRRVNLNKPLEWGNLILKATEVLRFQWHRKFVIAFWIRGSKMRMFRIDRSYVLVSQPVDIQSDGGLTLVKFILASLVLPDKDVGLASDNLRVAEVDGCQRAIVTIAGKQFVLDNQLILPSRDHLASRATSVHMARALEDPESVCCLKTNWAHSNRPHEGLVLKELEGLSIPGIASVLAFDSGPTMPFPENRYQPQPAPKSSSVTPQSTTPGATIDSKSRTPQLTGTGDGGNSGRTYHLRQYRQTVTNYIPYSFAHHKHEVLDLLKAWRSLYIVVNRIARAGWVHRDLSWNNVRLDGPSAILIDFDLTAEVEGEATGLPYRTGTPLFMPMEALLGPERPFRHQELHEYEAVFWVGFFSLIRRSEAGRHYLNVLIAHNLEPDQLATKKINMTLGATRRQYWPHWFSGSPDEKSALDIARNICREIVELQFPDFDYFYPQYDGIDGPNRLLHKKQQEDVFNKIIKVFDNRLNPAPDP